MSVEDTASQISVIVRNTVYSMTEKTQFPGFMFMFSQVVQKH